MSVPMEVTFYSYFLFKILLFPLRFQSVSRNLKLLNRRFYQWKIILEFPILVVHDNNPGNCAVFKDFSILFVQPIVINNGMNAFQPSSSTMRSLLTLIPLCLKNLSKAHRERASVALMGKRWETNRNLTSVVYRWENVKSWCRAAAWVENSCLDKTYLNFLLRNLPLSS